MAPRYGRYTIPAARLDTNTLQVEGLFKRGSGFGGARILTKRPPNLVVPEEPQTDTTKEIRRQTRSNSMSDEWIKVPVEVPMVSQEGEWKVVDGVAFYSTETKSLYQLKGLVYVEATVSGSPAILSVPEGQLPMLTEEHPDSIMLSTRLQEERKRRLDNARHMRNLKIDNEKEWHRSETKIANQSYERDVDKLKSSMLDKVNRRLEAIGQMMKEEEQQQVDSIDLDDAISGLDDDKQELTEEQKARLVVHEVLFKRPTLIPPRPWAPRWDPTPSKKRKITTREGRYLKLGADSIRDEEYVDIFKLIERKDRVGKC